ncbi:MULTISPECIES: hypothetical protein [unclassified Saccharicrinis]|uniref:hypothetical protein n=1 Tax=unclassified Saccharicrinis TaxID=2646859 RepID=UPI003D34F8A4
MNWKKITITTVRIAIGWHFLYEGISKIVIQDWSAASYLMGATGPFSDFYHGLGESETLLKVVDLANMYGLVLIGFSLFLGVAIRISSISAILLLTLYYFAYPPFGGTLFGATEGNLYIVNRIFLEASILAVLLSIKEKGYGIFALSSVLFSHKSNMEKVSNDERDSSRREALRNLITVPVLGVFGVGAIHENNKYGVDTLSGATIKIGKADISELKGELPKGKIGAHEISRLVMGGNLIGGWSHSRDLIYVSSLFRAYNTEAKIFETLQLAEEAGINTINIGYPTNATMQKYKRVTGSKIKVISQVGHNKDNPFVYINKAIDYGVDIIQIIGNSTDVLVRDGKITMVDKMVDEIRRQGYTAGIGAHALEALVECENAGIIPDYWMKTMHHDQYWSAHPKENRSSFEVMGGRNKEHDMYHDNLFCSYPEKTIDFVNNAKVPVMGFKVLAAGAIKPEDGFNWAFENGADFICVGMFDFQVVNNVNTTIDVLNNLNGRRRRWYG